MSVNEGRADAPRSEATAGVVPSALPTRAALSVSGAERVRFLDGLLTIDVEALEDECLGYGALLTAQGKIVSDLFLLPRGDVIFVDLPKRVAAEMVRRLSVYKLRAAVDIALAEASVVVGRGVGDPRSAHLLPRTIGAPLEPDAETVEAYHLARIRAGVPDGEIDFDLGDAFPHDANMDLIGGVDFHKGCFVGQEVVSRMRHRGTARRRTVIVEADRALPATGGEIVAGGRVVGRLGTRVGREGLAVVRIDKVGASATIEGIAVTLAPPPGAPFSLAGPQTA